MKNTNTDKNQQSRRRFLKKTTGAAVATAVVAAMGLNHAAAASAGGDTNPVGSVILFAGPNIPDGYLVCDGRALSSADYPALFAAIGTHWGAGYVEGDGVQVRDKTDFNLPDMRNMTPIGVNGTLTGPWADPDADKRVARNKGGNTGNGLGTYQMDAIQDHHHLIHWGGGAESESGGKPVGTHGSFYGTGLNPERADLRAQEVRHARVSGATRVKNAAFYFIIKY